MAEGVARLSLRGSRSVHTCQNYGKWLWHWQALTFGENFFQMFSTTAYNYCTVHCHSRKELGMVRNQPCPTMTIFFLILWTKRQWQRSAITRSVRWRLNSAMSWMRTTDHRSDCGSQEVQHATPVTHRIIKRSAVLQSACPATLHS